MLEKTFNPLAFEETIYEKWGKSGAFACNPDSDKKPYTIMMPPPNVTGNLHVGHALTYTLQDVLSRFKRMQGFDVLWQPGTDHAGIATQFVVERQLAHQGIKRQDMDRKAFVEKIWEWKETSGDMIVRQQRRLGISPDWSRQKFTLDDSLNKIVIKAFVSLFNQNLIYKDMRLVNWDPSLQTAVSDLEVISREVKGNLWHIRYSLLDQKDQFITVATTRPETLLGDAAIAVHPNDDRYRHLIGRYAQLPLTDRTIPIVGDDYCDPAKGSGAVKITPAHDFNDFDVGRRHNLALFDILDKSACLNETVPLAYQGLSIKKARTQILEDLEKVGLLEKTESIVHTVPYGEKSGTEIQPRITQQWFVDAKTLAQPALEAVQDGRMRFIPEYAAATYFEWLNNIQPWCISRQIWWGHQIPVWYGPDEHAFAAETEKEAQSAANSHYGKAIVLKRDPDVLDTWFSSALWPFSTLGGPEGTPEMKRYYPTDVLDTGFDIIFFWVARMMMMGLHFTGEVPFRTVYIHGMVRDEKGLKMSKTKGNVINPITYMDKFGTDALRFTLCALAVPGKDVKLGESLIEGYRNFMTKIWNAARFLHLNNCHYETDFNPQSCRHIVNRWIVEQVGTLATSVHSALEIYRFDEATGHIYQFFWGTFCDYYLEFLKPVLKDEALAPETRRAASWAFIQILKIAHPFIPFITEILWHDFTGNKEELLISQHWPEFASPINEGTATEEMNWLVDLISVLRSRRAEFNIPASTLLPLTVYEMTPQIQARLSRYEAVLMRMGRIDSLQTFAEARPASNETIQFIIGQTPFALSLGNKVDIAGEINKFQLELDKILIDSNSCRQRLSNPDFMSKAKPEIIEEMQNRLETFLVRKNKIEDLLRNFKS